MHDEQQKAMDRTLATALAIAEEAGRILLEGWDRRPTVEFKSSDADVVTAFDRRSEATVVARLRAAFPGDAIVGEEGADVGGDAGGRCWYVDPLDGTINFAHGLPLFAVSLGLVERGEPLVGVVHAPALGMTFAGGPGLGATRNGAAIGPSATEDVDRALLATGFPTARGDRQRNLQQFAALTAAAQATRRLGSAALDLCFVACGWLDGYWEGHIKPWDTAGGVAIVRGAGGKVTAYDGGPFDLTTGQVLATNGRVHQALVRVLGG